MKKYFYIIYSFFIGVLLLYTYKVNAILPLTGKTIIIDPGHGSEDPGATFGSIYEKDINLNISLALQNILGSMGANVIMTRDGDYDLSTPNAVFRKKSDFDNRINIINNSNADLYISIHLNYLSDSRFSGPQVFFDNDSKSLAKLVQDELNKSLYGKRNIKKIPSNTYMYKKLKVSGILIECGFLSNKKDRELLITSEYQNKVAKSIAKGIYLYF